MYHNVFMYCCEEQPVSVTGGLGRIQVHRLAMVTGQSKGFIGRTDDQGRAGRVNGKVTDRWAENRRWVSRRGVDNGRAGRQARGNKGADRPAGTRRQAGGQTGEGSTTGNKLCEYERRSGRD